MTMAPAGGLDAATESAIDWLVLLRSGEATPADRRGLDDWLTCSPAHRHAWARLAGSVDAAFAPVRQLNQRLPGQAETLHTALGATAAQSRRRRQLLRGALAFGGVGLMGSLLAQRQMPLQELLADFQTATGERRAYALADGSRLLLNARSAADNASQGQQRSVLLRRGEALVDTVAAALPFVLASRHGSLTVAPGYSARLLLRQDEERSLAVALHDTALLACTSGEERLLRAGDAAWFGTHGVEAAPGMAEAASAWQRGQLEVHDRPLGEVVAALQAYRRGFIRISPEAAQLRVYGSYPLDDSDRALHTIGETLPVAVHLHSGGWLVRITLA